ncbi:MAG: Ig-like domain-containing protein [Planctomycetes bacterium]|nr:Ig-like domain-containing protein [Planctomycetota bacterium]
MNRSSTTHLLALTILAASNAVWMGGCPCETNPAHVVSTDPPDGAVGVAPNAAIRITFDRAALPASLDGSIAPDIAFTDTWSDGDTVLTVTPTNALAPNTTYMVTITSCDFADGCYLLTPHIFTFTTADPDANGQTGTWRPAGFGAAGNFIGVWFDPSQAGVVYAASDVAGVLRSTDDGATWELRSVGLGNLEVSSFAIDPFDVNTLYAGTGAFATSSTAGIYVSRDAGLTWEHLSSTAAHGITFRRFRTVDALAADPSQPGVIIGGSRSNGIWRTTDSGASWTRVYAPPQTSTAPPSIEGSYLVPDDPTSPPFPAPVSSVAFDPANPGTVYAGLLGAGVVKSTNGGVTWQQVNNGLPSEATTEYIAVGPNGVLYAALGFAGVYRSNDGAATWQAVNGSVPLVDGDGMGWRTSVAVHPTNADIAFMSIATNGAEVIWQTTDGGATWVTLIDQNVTYDTVNDPTRVWSAGSAATWQVKIDPHNASRLLAVSFWTIQRSEDGGANWTDSIVGAQNTCATSIYADTDHAPGTPDTLYATFMDAGLMRSTNQGQTWTPVAPSGPAQYETYGGHFWRFASARVGNTRYHYTTCDLWPPVSASQVLRSADGVNWTAVFQTPRQTGSFMSGMMGLAVDPTAPATVYAAQDGGQVFKTTDSGDTWVATGGQPGGNSFTYALTVDAAGRVFAGTLLDGLWRSTDGGGTWQRVLPELGTVMQCVAAGQSIYAAGGDANLHRSNDGGEMWETLTAYVPDITGDGVSVQGWGVAVDPADANHILFTRQDAWHPADAGPGIVESFDGGLTWDVGNQGLGLLSVHSIAFGSDGTLYAATSCGGVWRRPPTE